MSGERATEVSEAPTAKPVKAPAHNSFGMNMPLMSSAFDTAMWLSAA